MEKKALKDYPLPEYPTMDDVPDLNGLICNSFPNHWKAKSLRYSALAILLASIGNAQSFTIEDLNIGNRRHIVLNRLKNDQISQNIESQPSQMAPVFYHGDGAGAVGCVAVSYPIFIPENEALNIIKFELAKAEIALDVENVIIPLPMPINYGNQVIDSLLVEGYSTTYNLLINFVGNYESSLIFGPNYSTASEIKTRAAADSLADILADTKGYRIVQFYDPLVIGAGWGATPEESQAKCNQVRELLALQVKDFVDWAQKNKFLTPVEPTTKMGNK